ncbi:hypothetical protein AwWohl_07930 [Gammaproteobacteria bacterium]|nr:hypothetical protein AwWohl_07930 [Gammaproteobacteria bacterium]
MIKYLINLIKMRKENDSSANGSSLPTLPDFGFYIPQSKNDYDALIGDWEKVGQSIRYGMSQVELQIKHDDK